MPGRGPADRKEARLTGCPEIGPVPGCPDYARLPENRPGCLAARKYARLPGVRLTGLCPVSGKGVTGCGRPNAGRQLRRWQACEV